MIEVRECKMHGNTSFVFRPLEKRWRCRKCAVESVVKVHRNRKLDLVKMFGGKCVICGYDKYVGALQFHHKDPKEKSFGISQGYQRLSLDKLIEEAKKCILICANCHAEIEDNKCVIGL